MDAADDPDGAGALTGSPAKATEPRGTGLARLARHHIALLVDRCGLAAAVGLIAVLIIACAVGTNIGDSWPPA